MTDRVFERLKREGIYAVRELSLSSVCTFRVGGVCDLGVYPDSEEQMGIAVRLLREEQLPVTVIGRGSNLLFGDGRLRGALLLTERMRTVERKEDRLFAAAGAGLGALAIRAAEEELGGLEFARGIPGSLGGAIYMNAGAYGSSIGDVLCYSRAMDRNTGEIVTLTDHALDYRKSIYMKHPEWICLGAELVLAPRKRQEIEATMAELSRKRRESQPLEYPSAGSYFKRPEGHFAGKLIEDAGLKGTRVGGAEVSEKHAGFLLNRGGATAEDILALEALVCRRVRELFGVTLVPEVQKIETE